MNLGSGTMSLGDKGCQSLLSQGNKSCKSQMIHFFIEKCFDY